MKKIIDFIKKNKHYFIGICIMMISQSFLFMILKLFQSNPVYLIHPLDDKIPFIAPFIYIYNLFYPAVMFSLYLLYKKDVETFDKAIIAGTIGYLICYTIYLLLPTIMYRPVIPSFDPVTDLIIKITYFFDDPPLNCFPSIHCLFCFQAIYSYLITKKYKDHFQKIPLVIFLVLIILSTLFVKQHFVYDVLGSFIVCLFSNLIVEIFHLQKLMKKI